MSRRFVSSFLTLFGFAILVLPVMAATSPKSTAQFLPENPLKGREVFVQKGCVVCHSVYGTGGSIGPDLAVAARGKHFLELAGLLWNHTPRMLDVFEKKGKEWPSLTPGEISNVFGYLYYLNYFEPQGDFNQGKKLFKELRCIGCHSAGGQGGHVGPVLDKYGRDVAPVFLASGLWNHTPAMLERLREAGPSVPAIQGADLADILAYIRGVTLQPDRPRRYLSPASPRHGQTLFSSKGCIHCHSVRGQGGKVGPDLAYASLTVNAATVTGILWSHAAAMRQKMKEHGVSWIQLSPEEMADIIAYLYFLEFADVQGDADRGARLYKHELGCGQCHQTDENPTGEAPDLRESEVVLSPSALAAAMWNHAGSMHARMNEKKIPWPLLQKDDVADILAYLSKSTSGVKK